MKIERINPDTLAKNPAFSQVVAVSGPHRVVYVGGQDAVDSHGAVVGRGDIRAQTVQVVRNLRHALAAAGASLEHVVKWNVYVVQGQDLRAGFEAFQQEAGVLANPPAISGMFVAALAHPDFLVEIDAVAAVPDAS